jgi:hypothetical protein
MPRIKALNKKGDFFARAEAKLYDQGDKEVARTNNVAMTYRAPVWPGSNRVKIQYSAIFEVSRENVKTATSIQLFLSLDAIPPLTKYERERAFRMKSNLSPVEVGRGQITINGEIDFVR